MGIGMSIKFIKALSFGATFLLSQSLFAAEQAKDQNEISITELKAQVDALAAALEAQGSQSGNSGATTLGGYGEHHYNNLTGDSKDSVDAHRFVLFVGHEYSDTLKLFSELEVEHGLVKDTDDGSGNGEVELEQAYVEKTFSNNMRLTLGQFLIPVGFLNETHEPDTFYGVERNAFEKNVIPTTWWETGAMLSGDLNGVSYDFAIHTGLNVGDDPSDPSSIRSARQKSSKADGNDAAYTARVKGTPIKGVELAVTVQMQSDLTQGAGQDMEATLINVQAVWQIDRFTSKAAYAAWDIDDFDNSAYTEQEGLSAEVAYKITNDLGVFSRYSEWDNAAGDSGYGSESAFEQVDVGVNYWLDERVVVKADYQQQTKKSDNSELNGMNVGLGWSF